MKKSPGNQDENHLRPSLPKRVRRWPRRLLITGLIASHLAFFLPLRAFVPIAIEADPWWGIGLVIADEVFLVMLIRAGIRKRTSMETAGEDK